MKNWQKPMLNVLEVKSTNSGLQTELTYAPYYSPTGPIIIPTGVTFLPEPSLPVGS